jgi:hypothetical protein
MAVRAAATKQAKAHARTIPLVSSLDHNLRTTSKLRCWGPRRLPPVAGQALAVPSDLECCPARCPAPRLACYPHQTIPPRASSSSRAPRRLWRCFSLCALLHLIPSFLPSPPLLLAMLLHSHSHSSPTACATLQIAPSLSVSGAGRGQAGRQAGRQAGKTGWQTRPAWAGLKMNASVSLGIGDLNTACCMTLFGR